MNDLLSREYIRWGEMNISVCYMLGLYTKVYFRLKVQIYFS